MTCPDCLDGQHGNCANLRNADTSSFIGKHGSWCDCQHRPGPETAATRDDKKGSGIR